MTTRLRAGRMARWQRWSTYVVLAACAATGLVWFVLLDGLDWPPPRVKLWWVLHGVTAIVATMMVGGSLWQHVLVAWRHARGRVPGALNLALLAALIVSAALLMYGSEEARDTVHWVHVIAGLLAVVVFTVHVVWGKRRPGRAPHAVRRPAP